MPKLVLGPLLRYVGETQATVWVETDAAARVEVEVSPAEPGREAAGGGHGQAPTFQVQGHHYALVLIDGLEPDRVYTYRVELDGEQVWPEPVAAPDGPAFPASTIRTLHGDHPLRIAFGSCRVAAPHEPPWTLPPSADRKRGKGADALYAFALRMRDADPGTWPDLLLLLGDQIYADDTSEEVQDFIRSRRDVRRPPGLEVADFEEYTRLYWEAWGDPVLRWLLSTVPTAMIFDDHDISDDWNTSAAWVEHMRGQPTGGTSGSSAGSPPTGCTSTSATCPRTTWTTTRSGPRCATPATPPGSCASSPTGPTARSRGPAGATRATSAGPAWW